jgi:hypothetical protein
MPDRENTLPLIIFQSIFQTTFDSLNRCHVLLWLRSRNDDEPPLLSHGNDASLQPALHQKFHSYQTIRALRHGCLPSTEQLAVILRRLQAADLLDPDPALSEPGHGLAGQAKQWLKDLTQLLLRKNDEDQLQELASSLPRARVSVDAPDSSRQARRAKAKADAAAG